MAPTFERWNQTEVEPKIPDEEEKIESLISLVNSLQEKNFARHRHGFRGTHVKTQAIVKGTLTVSGNLPSHLSQGLFAHTGQSFPIAIRYANEPIHLADDRAPGPRGCGMKVFNVDDAGPWLDEAGQISRTQDFTFNNAPILELTDLPTCLEIFQLREKFFDDPEGLGKELQKRKDKDLQFAPAGLPNRHFMSYAMYSQSAYRYGDYIAKYALFPTGDLQVQLAEWAKVTDSSSREQHSEWLRSYFKDHDAVFDFRVQLCQDLRKQSVEDCSQEWDENEFPFETVGQVVLPKGQDVFDAARRAFWDDRMKLNTWYGLEAHRPLGSANRLRKELYRASANRREQINAVETQVVSDIAQIP